MRFIFTIALVSFAGAAAALAGDVSGRHWGRRSWQSVPDASRGSIQPHATWRIEAAKWLAVTSRLQFLEFAAVRPYSQEFGPVIIERLFRGAGSAGLTRIPSRSFGMIRERIINEWLGSTAIAAPWTAEFQQHGSANDINLGTQRFLRSIFASCGHV